MFFDEKSERNCFIDKIHKFAVFQESIFKREIDLNNLEVVQGLDRAGINKLELLKEELILEQKNSLCQVGNYWWKLPYEEVRNYLIYDLGIKNGSDDWMYEHKWITLGNGNRKCIVLYEVGHLSRFLTETYYNYEQLSQYSELERAEMASKFNKSLDKYAKDDIMFHDSRPVMSESTGNIYDSRLDYYTSLEYKTDRYFYDAVYKRSLYTEHMTRGITAKSNSLHYECIYEVCEIVVDNGELVYVKDMNGQFLNGKGDINDSIKLKYIKRDHEVLVAAAIAQCEEVRKISIKLFDNHIGNKADSYDMAMRQAEIFTCVANKML